MQFIVTPKLNFQHYYSFLLIIIIIINYKNSYAAYICLWRLWYFFNDSLIHWKFKTNPKH